jgi:hypothetical protein
MDAVPLSSRRQFASAAVGLLLAGCSGAGRDGAAPTETAAQSTEADTDTPSSPNSAALDLREANVVRVEIEQRDDTVDFSVTLHHDDDGEDGYANWWQVETLGGTRLGRRELAHPHATQPFTRSEPIEVPADTDCVVVRGHDETHDYGGRVVLLDLESGHSRAERQGAERAPFTASDCP